MKNILVQFRRRYLILRSTKSQKHECHRYPVFTLEKQNFPCHFSAHFYTPIRTDPKNFMTLTLIVRTFSFIYIIPPCYPFVPFKFEFRKMQKSVFRYFYEECFGTILKTILFCGRDNVKNTNVADTPVLPVCAP